MTDPVAIVTRPHPGSVTLEQIRLGMVLGLRTMLAPEDPPELCVVVSLPATKKRVYEVIGTASLEQTKRFTLQEVMSGKLDGFGTERDVYGIGLGPIVNGRWASFPYCTDETPEDPISLFADE